MPPYCASVTSGAGGQRVLRLSVDLPGVQEEALVNWRLVDAGGGTAYQRLLLQAEQWRLPLPLPVAVSAGEGAAEWRRQKFTITWPVL